jgi:hypothetical protein
MAGRRSGFWTTKRLWTHVGMDVRQHIVRVILGFGYDVSEKHFETNFHLNSAAVNLSMTIMGA